jgi:predicted dehydrogenase
MVLPARGLGLDGAVAPSERITMGCIGVGGQGQYNMRNFISQPDVQVVALCDVERGQSGKGLEPAVQAAVEQAQMAGRPMEGASLARYGDFRELLARDDIDAVTVCTPDHWHGAIAAAAARAGKDIYCEKPLTNAIPEGRAVCDAVSRYGRVLQTGSHERSNDSCRFAWELVHNGRIGALQGIEVNLPTDEAHHQRVRDAKGPFTPDPVPESLDYAMWLGPIPWRPHFAQSTHFGWRFVLDTGGGEMTDRGAHIIDLAQYILNADDTGPVELSASGTAADSPLFDAFMEFTFSCRYANGLKVTGSTEGPRGLKLIGSEGWIFIHIHGGRLEASDPRLLRETIRPGERHTERSPGHHRNFLDCVRTRRLPIAHAEIGQRTGSICHLLNVSMRLGRPLRWDPVRETVEGDDEANRLLARPMRTPWHV